MQTYKIDITERMKHYNVAGISIAEIKNGTLHTTECYGVLEAGTNKHVTSTSLFNACSISKFVTSMLVIVLCEKGILSLEEDVNDQLISWQIPGNEFTKGKQITLRDLLSHQAGLIDSEGSFQVLDENTGVPSMHNLLNGKTNYCTERVTVKVAPKTEFHYSDAGFCITQQVIEDRCGKPFEEVMKEYLFEPLQMKGSSYPKMSIDKESFSSGHHKEGQVIEGKYSIYPYAATAGLWTTPTDLSYVLTELMNALKGISKLGLSRKLVKEVIAPYGCKEWTGLGCFLDETEQGVEVSSLGWGIGFQCLFVAYPHKGHGLIVMTNTDLGVHQLEGIIGEIVKMQKV
ncbi:serine hydrolase domain-containing protein [Priestia taiwanensis]|uniref:Penicillin-binding protein n=1 Tax=Priestia taiwanensis TaxID=1347902 RepID=A0A917ANM3_9BACI|nr:serine hydrolase domain-containing protein [Priestia taiwanensis]MBM7362648.1 CubicO group peptidase (beta-lactamase class C family) [Priestia taiwanensis]GGE63942.1 penicillin-binding protein [Priestia taiwanensis]